MESGAPDMCQMNFSQTWRGVTHTNSVSSHTEGLSVAVIQPQVLSDILA